MADWRRLFERSTVIPPHSQCVRLAQDGTLGFQLAFGQGAGQRLLSGLQEAPYQLRVSLFDVSHRHFFGRTWTGSPQQMRSSPSQPCTVTFNEVLYFHTSLRHPNVVAIVEVVSLTPKSGGSHHALGCGFGILHLFTNDGADSQTQKRLTVYHGSPRALLHPDLHHPVEKNSLMTAVEGAYLQYTLQRHPALDQLTHLLPENILVSGSEVIPGVVPSSDASGDSLRKPRLLKSLTCYLDKLSISLGPSLEVFEEELLQRVGVDHLSRMTLSPNVGDGMVIQERRLHVGVHNGWCFLESPHVVVVEPEVEGGQGSRLSRSGSFRQGSLSRLSSHAHVLRLRSRLQLKEMVKHPAFAIVLQLEYVFSAPVGGDSKPSSTSSISRMAFMQCLRWAAWPPFQENPSQSFSDVCLPLEGGAAPNPGSVMVYAATTTSGSSSKVSKLDKGYVKFGFSILPDGSSSSSVQHKTDASAKPPKAPSPSPGVNDTVLQVTPPRSPQGPGLSLSQLNASPRYPTISHSAGLSWQQHLPPQLQPSLLASAYQQSHAELPYASSIAHLEVSLGESQPSSSCPMEEQLRELAFTPVHAPVIALGTQASRSSSFISRSSLAHLYSAGFPDILSGSGEVAEVLDPAEPVNFNPLKEEADPLPGNKLILQFLAFSRIPQEGVNADCPKSVHFTLQLYRFAPVRTGRLKLLSSDKAQGSSREPLPCILALSHEDGSLSSGSPGLELTYQVDSGFLKPGEHRWFLRYLALHTLQIDVWDSESLLLIGSAAVELKHMLRQGRPAVQAMQELEVITTEYLQDAPDASGAATPVSVVTAVKGRLYLRMGNVGLPISQHTKQPRTLPPSRSHVIQAPDSMSGFSGGGLSSAGVRKVSRAQRLVDIDSELASLLYSSMKERRAAVGLHTETEDTRQRKMDRMEAVRQFELQGKEPIPKIPSSLTSQREALSHDLRLIEEYRERTKTENIGRILSLAITVRHTLYATLGTAEFFEFALRNPFSVPQSVSIECSDPELSVIVNCREWRHFKELTKTVTPLEQDMFHLREGGLSPQVYLRPKEMVYIPLKYQTFTSDQAGATQHPSSGLVHRNAKMAQRQQSNTIHAKTITVTFRAEDGRPLAICQVEVEPTPHVIDQTFRFYHPELTFLKKAIRLPPWEATAAPAGGTEREQRIQVRCSDPNVICDTMALAPGEPQDVFLKVAGGPSPQIRKFFIAVFMDEWMSGPAQIWQVYVHFLQRVDVSCVTGQLTRQSLVLKGTQALRRVRCYTSHPAEIQIDPPEVFALPPNAVQDLQIRIRPHRAGSRFVYLNVVDVEQQQLVACWLICVSCRQPIISKAFEISLPVGAGRGSNKKITYKNQYKSGRTFLLRSDHPDLLQFKEDTFQIGPGETYNIGLRFAPSHSAGTEEILIFINDHEDKNEETFCIRVKYR